MTYIYKALSRIWSRPLPVALFDHELASQISVKVGIPANQIDVYASGHGWSASLLPVANWTPAKLSAVKTAVAAMQPLFTLKRAAS